MYEHKMSRLYGIGFLARKNGRCERAMHVYRYARGSFKNTGRLVLFRQAIDIRAGCCIDPMKTLAGSALLTPTLPGIEWSARRPPGLIFLPSNYSTTGFLSSLSSA